MINWVPKKNINLDLINKKINECIENKHFTNNGWNVRVLQSKIKKNFYLDDNKEVLLVNNGSAGINALIGGLNIYYNKKLRFVVQSFTFPCSRQGLLLDSIIFDIDENMGPNIVELEKNKNNYDGILITNCFGCSVNIKLYEEFCQKNNKILLYDNAASPYTIYDNKNHLNYGHGCMVSLHHTKSIGFGEGGFIVFDKEYLESMKKVICFGYTEKNRYEYNIYASNYKMSEIACIYIDEYLKNLEMINHHHRRIIKYFIEKIKENNLESKIKIFKNYSEYENSLMACIPIIFNSKIETKYFLENNIEVKKYYYPLEKEHLNSLTIFENIICFPLNLDINENIIDIYVKLIKNILY
jgi:dTDP-4-amino-4,6-dideoxygalactose transaminase